MVAVFIWIILVTILATYAAIGTYHNQQDIKDLAKVTKGIGYNAEYIYQIFKMLKEQEGQ